MSIFIVRMARHAETPPAMIGVYQADGADALARQIEPLRPPRRCEYALVPHGCMYGVWSDGPEEATDGTDPDGPAEDWRDLFFGPEPPRWQPLHPATRTPPADQDDPRTCTSRARTPA